jgi:hypothetical protein
MMMAAGDSLVMEAGVSLLSFRRSAAAITELAQAEKSKLSPALSPGC